MIFHGQLTYRHKLIVCSIASQVVQAAICIMIAVNPEPITTIRLAGIVEHRVRVRMGTIWHAMTPIIHSGVIEVCIGLTIREVGGAIIECLDTNRVNHVIYLGDR